jgi:acyl dehydratase
VSDDPAGATDASRTFTEEKGLYLDDLHVGQRVATGERTLSLDEIKDFARSFDPQPFHLDEVRAAQSLFGGLAASGWHTAAITMRLLVDRGFLADGLIGMGIQIEWPRPTRPGDTLHVESEVLEIVPSRSRPDRGTVTMRNRTLNQRGEVVQEFTGKLMAFRRKR